jgi:hypothetical protein
MFAMWHLLLVQGRRGFINLNPNTLIGSKLGQNWVAMAVARQEDNSLRNRAASALLVRNIPPKHTTFTQSIVPVSSSLCFEFGEIQHHVQVPDNHEDILKVQKRPKHMTSVKDITDYCGNPNDGIELSYLKPNPTQLVASTRVKDDCPCGCASN